MKSCKNLKVVDLGYNPLSSVDLTPILGHSKIQLFNVNSSVSLVAHLPISGKRKVSYGLSYYEEQISWLPTLEFIDEIESDRRTTKDILKGGESQEVEFKSSMRWDYRKGETQKALEIPVIKTIAGFLSASGGTLLIGVNNKGEILGIEKDYFTLRDWDGFQNHLTTIINDKIGAGFRSLISISREVHDGLDICRVDVNLSPEPVYVVIDGKKALVVRQGGRTQILDAEEVYRYMKRRWPSK